MKVYNVSFNKAIGVGSNINTASQYIICIEKIVVDFSNLEGLERRPIAHICGATLELSTTYSSFPQFREEMNNILSSDFWDIDIC